MSLDAGTVIARHGSLIRVQIDTKPLLVTARGTLEWEDEDEPVKHIVVGDHVLVEHRRDEGVITRVNRRTSSLKRKAVAAERPQILAANVDQALLVFATKSPEPKQGLLDRFLVACHLASIEPIIVFNKIDHGHSKIDGWVDTYRRLGYQVLLVSARSGWGLGQVKRILPDRTSLFCGPSGAGKSSLLNAVYPGFRLRVGSLSEATGKGRHTTTLAELMPLPYGGFVVDTPGLKEFGLWDLTAEELTDAFPEFGWVAGRCRFANCSHTHEPDCAVREAVEARMIDRGRYRSYGQMLEEIAGAHGA